MSVDTRRAGLVESERLIQLAAGGEPIHAESTDRSGAYRAGDLIGGKYRLLRLIGRGGMGVVWEAYSDALDISVAVKLIHQFTAGSEEQNRLLLEAKAAARLGDPAVVRIFDCGETLNGEPYVVMELLKGQDLATRLDERGRLQPIDAVRTILPIVRALGVAHAACIVHRDVKPENVFLARSSTGEEQPKLLDFGIAKMDLPWEKRLTRAGSTLGSPNYMSPEQARGEEVDGRSDLWGICVVLYEAIAGELPFDGSNYNAVMHAILSARITPFTEIGVQEPDLWAIVARGLVRERERRWQTSAELAEALGGWLLARGVVDDVTGVSLQSTQSHHRSSYVRTLDSVRPAPANRRGDSDAQAAVAQTGSDFSASGRRIWAQRPRWFIPVMVCLLVFGIGAMGWRLADVARRDADPSAAVPAPVAPTKPSVARPAIASPSVEPVSTSSAAAAPLAPSQPPPSRAIPSARRASAPKRPVLRPSPSKAAPFKNPFE